MLCWAALLSSCVNETSSQGEPHPPDRIHQKGYSFIPPRGEEWATGIPNPDQVVLSRRGKTADETVAIQGVLVTLPLFANTEELVIFVKDGQTKGTDLERFKMIKHAVSAQSQKGTACARSYALTEEIAPGNRSEEAGHLFFETATITCAHPRNPRIGVNVAYSHRSYPEHRDTRFVENASGVLESIEFHDL